MKLIPLTQGKFAMVDDEDFEDVNKFKWCLWRTGKFGKFLYAGRGIAAGKNKRSIQLLHRFITNAPVGVEVDHIDGNGLNNQKENLRLCNRTNNQGNRRMAVNNTSGLKGVSWDKPRHKWKAKLQVGKRQIYLGLFASPLDAAKAHDAAAIALFGEFARTNEMLGAFKSSH